MFSKYDLLKNLDIECKFPLSCIRMFVRKKISQLYLLLTFENNILLLIKKGLKYVLYSILNKSFSSYIFKTLSDFPLAITINMHFHFSILERNNLYDENGIWNWYYNLPQYIVKVLSNSPSITTINMDFLFIYFLFKRNNLRSEI